MNNYFKSHYQQINFFDEKVMLRNAQKGAII
ncbi:hypothetical protein JEOAER750_01061 [Jeotgalicoccus aerolatus]|uniref:Uncharacterized protein n=1 Tax=Jeotgalicoccus aerolatus TaxID=709510 RepID=A0ABS4HLT1_9STAP|nr:hypothetical protein [Jeotgalicoccus aerolatus]CAD2074922.1 hypothetical protein JEOAER750_01061 [Jeotgalicoccus aerolatus]